MTDKLRTLFTGKNTVRGATGLLVLTLALSNVLGLIRDRFLAATIPADQLDSYYAAFRLPDLLTNLIVVGAIAVAFLPLFTEIRTRDARLGWQAANAILNVTIVTLMLGSLFLIVAMPYLMPWVVPDFSPEKLATTITLARWLALTPILFGVSYLLSGILNSFERFAIYALAPLVYNLAIIAATVISGSYPVDSRVMIVTGGVLAGAAFHMLIQVPLARRLGWQWGGILTIAHPAVRRLRNLMVPRMIGLFAMQLTTIVATAIASGWAGAITYLSFATNISTMPTVVFANSIATATFPSLSVLAAQKADTAFREHLVQGIRWILFLLIPAAAGLIILRIQVVRIVLGAGFFDWEATQVTADVLGWLGIGVVAAGLIPLLARSFYARLDMKTPMMIALVSALITIGLSFLLPRVLPSTVTIGSSQIVHVGEVAALAIAGSIGMILNATLLLIAANRTFYLSAAEATRSAGSILLATAVMAVAVQVTKTLVGTNLDLDRVVGIIIQTAAGLVVGVAVYLLMAKLLRIPEWQELAALAAAKISTKTSIALD